jgi:malate dehydrogenase (oxaloacetate-decarboxylating)
VDGKTFVISQCNNLYVFPAVGLAVSASGAPRVTDGMMLAAARAVGDVATGTADPGGPLLPPLEALPALVPHIALQVALQAVRDGVAPTADEATLRLRIEEKRWVPQYGPILPAD